MHGDQPIPALEKGMQHRDPGAKGCCPPHPPTTLTIEERYVDKHCEFHELYSKDRKDIKRYRYDYLHSAFCQAGVHNAK